MIFAVVVVQVCAAQNPDAIAAEINYTRAKMPAVKTSYLSTSRD